MTLSTNAPTATAKDGRPWTLRGLIAEHRVAAWTVAALIAVMVAMIVVTFLGARAGAVTDATTCTTWGSSNQSQQSAYARLYVREHGALRGGVTSPASVINAINNGCNEAYADDVSDNTTVIQAITGDF